jgi:SH3 domain protein
VKARIIGLALIGALAWVPAANAKTLYIHDSLRVDMRSGPTTGHRILDFLPSGTAMQVLSEQGEWIQVRVGDKEGWVQVQYTTPDIIARDKLERALREIGTLKTENKNLRDQLNATQGELGNVKSNFDKVSGSATDLQKELSRITTISRTAVETEAAYRKLQEDTEMLKVDMEKLKVENVRLKDDNFNKGIQWGMGAVLMGVILAWLISKVSSRKRRSDW